MNLLKVTSISKKIVLASVGLFLIVFLLVHLSINLCLLRADHGAWFYNATNFMGTNYIVKVFEVVLFAAIIIHICLAIALQIQNWMSRPVRYKVRSKSKTSTGSRFMIWTGGLVLCFLVLHFFNFYFVKLDLVDGKYMATAKHIDHYFMEKSKELDAIKDPAEKEAKTMEWQQKIYFLQDIASKSSTFATQQKLTNLTKEDLKTAFGEDFKDYEPDFYNLSIELFTQKSYAILYIALFIVLGLHLFHAFRSAFQTLGLNHNKYNNTIKYVALAYTVVIVVGFSIIPLYFQFCFKH